MYDLRQGNYMSCDRALDRETVSYEVRDRAAQHVRGLKTIGKAKEIGKDSCRELALAFMCRVQ